ncbi:restriction endonuclease subunit S [Hyphomonas sp.]|uniref:restriction endonuclease subunit S n=1 Tax=Hyphomonas sp. TaxID=87 RepID=UPI00262A2561|nr:restriction endonuclease subunit S [Hyphomonas sp.]MDF1807996.1 restriction endonuclease subunit S [Hyphomonas sp.]
MITGEIRSQINEIWNAFWAGGVAKGVAQKTVTLKELKAMEVPIPSLAAQDRFVSVIAQMDKQRGLTERAAKVGEKLFASLQQRAFRGEL